MSKHVQFTEKTNNELIAKFMGLPLTKREFEFSGKIKTVPFLKWKYNSSWDWLMPVVEKIAEYRLAYPDETNRVCNCKIVIKQEYLYEKVIAFIKWYNQQSKL